MSRLVFCLFIFTSCHSYKRAVREVTQAQAQYPEVVRAACVAYYPTKDSVTEITKYMQGRTDTFTQMVEVPCGEVVFFDTIINNVEVVKEKLVNKLVKVPCKPCYNRVDTIYKDKFISYENTALIGVKDDVIDSLTVTSIEAVKDAKDWRKSTYKLIALLSLLVMIPIGYKLIKLKYG